MASGGCPLWKKAPSRQYQAVPHANAGRCDEDDKSIQKLTKTNVGVMEMAVLTFVDL